jgi:hypothetical protein
MQGCAELETQPKGVPEASSKETRSEEAEFSERRLQSFSSRERVFCRRESSHVRRVQWQTMTAQ